MRNLLFSILIILSSSALAESFSLSEGTEARFYINEVLLGNDKTVVGVTPLVTGSLNFDLADPGLATIGNISVDASDFTTDDSRRNGAIRTRILNTNQEAYQFIHFETTAISGLPVSVAVGDRFDVQITGNLRIKEEVREETFAATVEVISETELHGLATTTILHQDYGLTIPRVPMVARVDDEVTLEIAFIATSD